MITYNTTLKVAFVGGQNFQLIEDFNYVFKDLMIEKELINKGIAKEDLINIGALEAGNLVYINIPKGFNTDFGSIPQLFQSLVSPIGSPTKAYVLHDYLLSLYLQGKISERKICDKTFRVALRNEGVGMPRRSFMYLCVRFYSTYKDFVKKIKDKFKKD